MSYRSDKSTNELWAILDQYGAVMWSRGGSSTRPHLMVYTNQESAERAIKGPWIKQIIKDRSLVRVECIYKNRQTQIGRVD